MRVGRWTTGVTREALQPCLRAICYRQKSDRDERQNLETRPGRDDYPLCASLPGGEGIILRGDRWTTGVTREALQPHLGAICYRQKSDRGARQLSLKTRPGRDGYLLCAPLPGGQGIILRGGRWTTGVTREALQPHLRAINYRQKSDRGARQA